MRSTEAVWFGAGAMALSAVPAEVLGGKYLREATLTASDQRADDALGLSIAMDENTLVGGAFRQDTGGQECGAVYVFTHQNDEWNQVAKLLSNDPTSSLYFGYSVAISENTILVGAYGDPRPGGHASGSAYVFTRINGVWMQQAKLVAPDASPNAAFGLAVGICGDVAVIGAPEQTHPTGHGSAYVFQRTDASWQHAATLVALDGAIGDQFGYSVAVSASHILIGSPRDDNAAGVDAGAAYVFAQVAGTWTQTAKLVGANSGPEALFGYAVSSTETEVAVSSLQEAHSGLTLAGAVYVFDGTDNIWSQTARLTADDANDGDSLGAAVSFCGDLLVAGARYCDIGAATETGAVYVFKRSNQSWSQLQKIHEFSRGKYLGNAVAVSCGSVAIGHYLDAVVDGIPAAAPAGTIWVYSNGVVVPPACPADLNGNGVVDLSDLAILLASFGLVCP